MVRETWRLIAATSFARIYWVFATLLTAVITARYLGPSGRGVLVASTTWVTALYTFGYLSLSQVVIFLAAGKKPEEWLSEIIGGLVSILAPVAAVSGILVTLTYVFAKGSVFNHIPPSTLLIAFCALPMMLWVECGNGVLMALGSLHILNSAQMVGGTVALLFTFIATGPLHMGVNGAVGAWVMAQMTMGIITFSYVVRRAGGISFGRTAASQLLRGAVKLHMNAIGTYLFTQANILLLNHYRSTNETAWYQLAAQIIAAIQIIPMAVSTVAFSLVSKHGPDDAWPLQRKLLLQVIALVVVLGAIAYAVSPVIVPLIFGAPFLPAVPILRILLLSLIGMTMSMVMASQWIGRGLFVQAASLTLIIGTLTLLGNYYAVPRHGMYGAAWVTVGTYTFSIVGNGIMAFWVGGRAAASRLRTAESRSSA